MPIRVYLVNDHAAVRKGLRCLLEAQDDMTVVGEAAGGRQAVQEVLQLRPDVVIMDIALSGLSGIEATQQIRQASPSTQIVILSLHTTNEHIFRSFRAGAKGYLLKEYAGQEVVEAVRAVHADRRFLSQQIGEMVLERYLEEHLEDDSNPLERLTSCEKEILQLLAEGKSSLQIGQILHLSTKRAETYRSRLMQKLKIPDLPSLVKFAIQHGLIELN
jgi:DNA-binding NarL/FixJ family response regulator